MFLQHGMNPSLCFEKQGGLLRIISCLLNKFFPETSLFKNTEKGRIC
jgi:hypothetical protein